VARQSNKSDGKQENTTETRLKTQTENPLFLRRLVRWLKRRPVTIVLILVATLVFGPYLFSRIVAPSNRIAMTENENVPAKTSIANEFSICCFNIAHGRGATDNNWQESGSSKPQRIAEISGLLKTINADIVVLNEVDFQSSWSGNQDQATVIAEAAGYRFCVQQRNLDFKVAHRNWKFGNAILSKFPIRSSQVINYPPELRWHDWLAGCNRGVACEIQINEKSAIRVVGVHLEHRSESVRLASAQMIDELALKAGPPLFAAGDFNSTPTGFPQSQQSEEGENTLDWLIGTDRYQLRPISDPEENELTFSTYAPKSVIDWILIPSGKNTDHEFSFAGYEAIATDLSDHRAVKATIVGQ